MGRYYRLELLASLSRRGPIDLTMRCPDPSRLLAHSRTGKVGVEGRSLDRHLLTCPACLTRFLTFDPPEDAPQIPGYRVIAEIGRGRFGVVYKAWRMGARPSLVALKLLRDGGEMERVRFEREIEVLRTISSPRVVRCTDSGAHADRHYFVMEYVDGVHLDEYVRTRASTLDEKLALFERVCRGVSAAHEVGVIHRDLKPKNILVTSDGEPHILDFGICSVDRAWGSDSWTRFTITQPGDIVGTLKYMSPEQAWGDFESKVDARTDIWALGVMLYELVTDGDYPYSMRSTPERPAHEALLERIRRELPRMPKLRHLRGGRSIETLIERCLTWDRSRRLDSAAVLADDVRRIREGRRIATRRMGVGQRLERVVIGAAVRARVAMTVGVIAAALVATSTLAFVSRAGWFVSTGALGASAASSASTSSVVPDVRDSFMVVGVGDETAPGVRAYAAEKGIDGVTDSVRTWRGVHARTLRSLADAGSSAIVWDYYFQSEQPADADFAAAAADAEARGVPVCFAAHTYDEAGEPMLSEVLRDRLGSALRHGTIHARDMVSRPGEYAVVSRSQSGRVTPSLMLTAAAALANPDATIELDWYGRQEEIGIAYRRRAGGYLRRHDRIQLTRATLGDGEASPTAFESGDLIGSCTFPLDHPAGWQRRTVAYEDLLRMSAEELETRVRGKIVVIGDMRTARFGFRADRHRVRYGRNVVDGVPGVFLIADGIAGLLQGKFVRSAIPLPPWLLAAMALAALAAVGMGERLTRLEAIHLRRGRRAAWIALAGASAITACVVVFSRSPLFVPMALAGLTLLLSLTGGLWMSLARNRYRRFESRRWAIEGLADASLGGSVASATMSLPRASFH